MIKYYGIVLNVSCVLIFASAIMTIFNVNIGVPGRFIYIMTLMFMFFYQMVVIQKQTAIIEKQEKQLKEKVEKEKVE